MERLQTTELASRFKLGTLYPLTDNSRYFVERESFATGGFSELHRGIDTKTNTLIAVKMIPEGMDLNGCSYKMLSTEAQVMATLDHPAAISLLDLICVEDEIFLIMEYIDPKDKITLKARIERDGPLSPKETLAITKQLASLTDYLALRGITHKDLNTTNVLVPSKAPKHDAQTDLKETIKVLDFGLSMLLLRKNQLFGSPRFMEPERLIGKKPGVEAEVYALSRLIEIMLAGTDADHDDFTLPPTGPLPNTSGNIQKNTRNVKQTEEIDLVLERGLQTSPQARWKSGLEVAMNLEFALLAV